MNFRIRRPSPALFVAIVALIVALSGSAFAIQRGQSGDSLIAQRTLSGNRLRLNTVTGQEVANLQWHNLNLINGWENYNGNVRSPAWAIDVQGIVHLRGAVDQGAANNSMIFARMPLAARPNANLYLLTSATDAFLGRLDLFSDGRMFGECPSGDGNAQAFFNLDGLTYSLS